MIKGQWNHNPITEFSALASSKRIRFKDKRHHPAAAAFWSQCIQVDKYSREELCKLQNKRLQDLVDHIVVHVPFYKKWAAESGFQPGDPVDLSSLPVVTKADYIADIDAFKSDAFDSSKLKPCKTSGSSGVPFRFLRDTESSDYTYCGLLRALQRFGLRPGDRRVYLWGRSFNFNSNPVAIMKQRARLAVRDWLNVTLGIGAYDLTFENAHHQIDRIERFDPIYMHGYVSAIYTLARTLLDEGKTLKAPRLKAVITESEKLYDFQKEAMEEAFGCPVLEHYGSVEFGNISQPDPDGNKRINEDLFVVERDEQGEAVITSLFSHAFPFLRYKLGDLIEFEDEIKPGLPYKSFKSIVGRTVDMIPVAAGGSVHGVALAHLVDPHLDEVLKFQFHQTALDQFVLRIIPKTKLSDSVKATIRKDMAGLLGKDTKVEILEVDHINPAESGKFRWVISDITQTPAAR